MTKKIELQEIVEKALAIWRSAGLDQSEGADVVNMIKDPLVKLLLGAVAYQSGLVLDESESLRSALLDDFLRVATPATLSLATPAVGMMHVGKGVCAGKSNNEPTFVDETISFKLTSPSQTQPGSVTFMPILRTRVADMEVVSVEQETEGRWHIAIAENETLDSLEGLSLLIKGVPGNAPVRISSGGVNITFYTLQDIGSLPFVSLLANLVGAGGNAAQYRMLQEMMDAYCLSDFTYCIFNGMRGTQPSRSGGCLHLQLEIPPSVRLTRDEVLLGCVPVANLTVANAQLSREHPIVKVEERNGRFFALVTPSAEVRRVGTDRLTASEWSKRLERLIAQFEENYNVFSTEMDARMCSALQQLLPALSDINSSPSSISTYIVLSDPIIAGLDATYLMCSGNQGNGFDETSNVEANSAEIDSNRTKMIVSSVGGRDETELTSEIQSQRQYFVRTSDRIVTRADLSEFCRYMLQRHFGIAPDRLSNITITPSIENTSQGFFERYTLVEIHVFNLEKDHRRISSVLERLSMSRMAGLSSVKFSVVSA